jgi:hypothetical protein
VTSGAPGSTQTRIVQRSPRSEITHQRISVVAATSASIGTPSQGRNGRSKASTYRWLRHPNYLGVAVEVVALPLVHTAWWTALAFGLANLWLLAHRIRVEDRALADAVARRGPEPSGRGESAATPPQGAGRRDPESSR